MHHFRFPARFTPTLVVTLTLLASCSNPNRMTDDGEEDGAGVEASTCRDRVDTSLEAIEAVRVEHLACEQASDCTLFDPSTECHGGCPLAVAASGLEAVRAAVDEVNDGVCRNFTADGCPYATPGCVQVFADCVENRCVTSTEAPGE